MTTMKTNINKAELVAAGHIDTTEATDVTISLSDYTALVRSDAVLDMILAFCENVEHNYAVDDIIATAKQVVAPAISFTGDTDDCDEINENEEVF